ncbi:alpha/beta fold hydrolase [Psychromonas sp. RZ22]|uniref:alpha/beta fold hydrolase n=1 Tax=Psychromonas algarum TaxID=2555643 RepID=UPI001068CD87|nr:alpha/beta fold hydrolase [Psychromonas sp. RZ22]TEW54435.1 alpha/beta fold hydrolase [Psychromonas sp. RZ22]
MLLNYQLKQSSKHELASKNEIIFFVHGLFGSLSNLSGLAKELQDDYDIILVDVRNHGRSPRNKSMTYQEMAEDIFELADSLNIEQFSILGHSMGGKIAMTCALLQPERVKRLIVADIAPTNYNDRHSDVFMGLKSVQSLQAENRTEAEKILAGYIETPEVRQFLLKSFQRVDDGFDFIYDVENLHNNYRLISAWPEHIDTYEKPTLFIKGALSDYINADDPASMMTLFPNAQLKIIEGTGHWLHAEKPKSFNRLVIDFFAL